jgi:hypothetical protein
VYEYIKVIYIQFMMHYIKLVLIIINLKGIFWRKFYTKRTSFVHFISEYSKEMSLFSGNKNIIIQYPHWKVKVKQEICFSGCGSCPCCFMVRKYWRKGTNRFAFRSGYFSQRKEFWIFNSRKGPLLDLYSNKIKSLNLNNITLWDMCLILML